MKIATCCAALVLAAPLCAADLAWRLPTGAERTGNLLTVSVPAGREQDSRIATAAVDLSPYAGKTLIAEIRVRGENVREARQNWLGAKFMISYTDSDGERQWPQAPAVTGTFDWKTVSFSCPLVGLNPTNRVGTLSLGLQSTSGKLTFDLASLSLKAAPPIWPGATNTDYKVAYPQRVRDLPPLRGVMLPGGDCTEDDFKTLHDWGATLVRYQMTRFWGARNANQDLADYDRWLDGKLDHLERDVLPWARRYGIKVVVDLHVAPGGRDASGEMNMFHDAAFADHFVACWRKIATRFRGHAEIYGFDLINEPNQQRQALEGCDYWNLQRRAAEAVRAIDPDTPVIIESNGWDGAAGFKYLSPLAMDNVIYQVHMYEPHAFTHQGVGARGKGWKPVAYPDPKAGWDREYIRARLKPVLEFRDRHHARIYVGEFSAIAWGPGADRFIADSIALFTEYGFDWSYHAFREWTGWSVEHETPSPGAKAVRSADNPRLRALKAGLRP